MFFARDHDPAEMTPDERRREAAGILAISLLRLLVLRKHIAEDPAKPHPTPLEAVPEKSLTVPVGKRTPSFPRGANHDREFGTRDRCPVPAVGDGTSRPLRRRRLHRRQHGAAGTVDAVVVYKVDRLSRSLLDFARMMQVFDSHKVSFVSVTQQFNTATSMGRLVLNVLLSFAQFEREIVGERTRDKIAATRRKGKWAAG